MIGWEYIGAVLQDGLFAAVAAVGFAVISNPPARAIPVAALLAAIGHALRFCLAGMIGISAASLAGAFAVGICGLLAARLVRCPIEVLSFPALLPMIPGMYAYKTILGLLRFLRESDVEMQQRIMVDIFGNGLTTVFVMFALVAGVSLPTLLFHRQTLLVTRRTEMAKRKSHI